MRNIVAVVADGGVIREQPSRYGGTWAYCYVDDRDQRVREASGVIPPPYPEGKVTNNVAEMTALVEALEGLPEGWSGTVCSDSQVSLGRLFGTYAMRNIPPALFDRARSAVARLGSIRAVRLDGHPTLAELAAGVGRRGGPVSKHQVWADEECSRQARTEYARIKAGQHRERWRHG